MIARYYADFAIERLVSESNEGKFAQPVRWGSNPRPTQPRLPRFFPITRCSAFISRSLLIDPLIVAVREIILALPPMVPSILLRTPQ